jgi:predicted RNA-binding Zn-ribbon protein involved in translation (DUF1610 family)
LIVNEALVLYRTRYEQVRIPCHSDSVRTALVPREDLRYREHTCSTCGQVWALVVVTDALTERKTSNGIEIGHASQVWLREGRPAAEPTRQQLEKQRPWGRWYRVGFDDQRLIGERRARRRQENRWHQEALRAKGQLLRCSNCGHRSDPEARGWQARLADGVVAPLCPDCLADEREVGGASRDTT